MPRLHGYQERLWTNLYDNVFYGRDRPVGPYVRLFESTNIGNTVLTNIFCAGQIHDDRSMVVTNWYARTNLLEEHERIALEAVANEIRVHLVVGMRPFYESNLAELLRRTPDITFPPGDKETVEKEFLERRRKKIEEISKATDVRKSVVAAVLDHVRYPSREVMIPKRQSYDVCVDVHNPIAINELIARFDRPTLHPAVWIHLEGWTTRHVEW